MPNGSGHVVYLADSCVLKALVQTRTIFEARQWLDQQVDAARSQLLAVRVEPVAWVGLG